MDKKKRAVRVGRLNTAKVISVNNHVLTIHGNRRIVNLDLERQGNILGGLALGVGIFLMCVFIPIMLG